MAFQSSFTPRLQTHSQKSTLLTTSHNICQSPTKYTLPVTSVISPLPPGVSTSPLSNDHDKKDYHLQPTTRDNNWMFYDVAKLTLIAGTGGNGIVSFRREKGVPRGGPSGGNGGRGGDIYLISTRSAGNTLSKFRFKHKYVANSGKNGQSKGKNGQSANDLYINVPIGTILRNYNTNEIIKDLKNEGDKILILKGGRGGRGNLSFKNDKNKTPRICENGEKGKQIIINLELKLLADIALIGLPNSGKSSFLKFISNANQKIDSYPFTTIIPNLGVCNLLDNNKLIFADIPGLINGSHKGIGMGISFLRHIERCKILVHLIDGYSIIQKYPDDLEKQLIELKNVYTLIKNELLFFNSNLVNKKEVLLINKTDLPNVKFQWENHWKNELVKITGHKRITSISAKTGEGLYDVIVRLDGIVKLYNSNIDEEEKDNENIIDISTFKNQQNENNGVDDDEEIFVKKIKHIQNLYEIGGSRVEQIYHMTNWNYMESIDRFQRVLTALGVNSRLQELGVKDGDLIQCLDRQFEYFKDENIYSAAAALDGYTD